MAGETFAFGDFLLDPADRRLTRSGETIEINARYLDALLLMVSTPGRLVSKDRFHAEVWRGIPVTDEALTQCIRTLRRALDDDASAPRFIETVPRHGYRFIAEVDAAGAPLLATTPSPAGASSPWPEAAAAALGSGTAGAVVGLAYASSGLIAPGLGAASTLLVMISLALFLGIVAGGAVGLGIALGARKRGVWGVAGGALAGLLVGGVAHIVGTDLFNLLFGRAPDAMTGAPEGLALGAAAGIGAWLAARAHDRPLWRRALPGFAAGGLAGLAIALLGGRLLAGSLVSLAAKFPGTHLSGETAFGSAGLALLTAAEGAMFAGSVAGALALARRLRTAS